MKLALLAGQVLVYRASNVFTFFCVPDQTKRCEAPPFLGACLGIFLIGCDNPLKK